MNKLNLIWCLKTQYEIDFSFDWINEIFSDFDINHHYDLENKFNVLLDNSIIIVCVKKESNPKLIEYINEFNTSNLNYSILHLSDEAFEQNIDFYSVSKKIIRNYFNNEYNKKYNILTIPLGYQSGIKEIKVDRDIVLNFVGQLKSDRVEMLNKFHKIENKYVHLTSMWGDPNGLNNTQFSSILSRSWFTLCPRGWIILDSFRINEALECGSIPVSILDHDGTDYFQNIYGNHPFIIGRDWEDSLNKFLLCDKESLRNECVEWWSNFKSELRLKINNFIKKN